VRLVVPLALLGVLAACGGGGKSSIDLAPITKNDLAIMVLPAVELGELAAGLEVDSDSGFQDAAAVAEDSIDPEDTASEIEQLGFRAGYQLDYSTAAGRQVTTEVALFGSAEEAAGFVATIVGGARAYEGLEIGGDATLSSVDVEEADAPGDTAWEGTATVTAGDVEFSSTVVAFTVDNVAATVSVAQPGEAVPVEEVQPLAEKLAARIEAVAAGDVSDTPVEIPTETTATTEQEDPSLERMVLSLDDLPAGVSIEREGYVTDGGDVSYEREFALGTATIGESELIGLESNAERLDSAAEAAVAVKAVSGIIRGPEGKRLFTESFAEGAGFDAESLEVEELPAEGIGDEATVLHATFDSRAGPFEAVFVFIASGDATGQIYTAAAKGKIVPEDIVSLARTMARKMEAER
jgi:hypothetical protein